MILVKTPAYPVFTKLALMLEYLVFARIDQVPDQIDRGFRGRIFGIGPEKVKDPADFIQFFKPVMDIRMDPELTPFTRELQIVRIDPLVPNIRSDQFRAITIVFRIDQATIFLHEFDDLYPTPRQPLAEGFFGDPQDFRSFPRGQFKEFSQDKSNTRFFFQALQHALHASNPDFFGKQGFGGFREGRR